LIIVKRHPANLVEPCIIAIKCNCFFLLLKSLREKRTVGLPRDMETWLPKRGKKRRDKKDQKMPGLG
jgi:hypothetical protein